MTEAIEKYSVKFQKNSNHDIVLVSVDKIKFRVPSRNLIVHSTVFEGMIDACGEAKSGTEIQLTESAEVLEVVLPYLFNKSCYSINLHFLKYMPVLLAFHKYEIHRGLDSVRDLFLKELHVNMTRKTNSIEVSYHSLCFHAYCFAKLGNYHTLAKFSLLGSTIYGYSWSEMKALRDGESVCVEAAKEFASIWLENCARASEIYVKAAYSLCNCQAGDVDRAWSKLFTVASSMEVQIIGKSLDVSKPGATLLKEICSKHFQALKRAETEAEEDG